MRKFLLGAAGAAALGLAALAPQAASAQGFSVTIGSGYGPAYYEPRPAYRPYRHHYDRPVYGRPVYGRPVYDHPRYAERCVVRRERYFDGYAWVSERRRICR